MTESSDDLLDALVIRCAFPRPGALVDVAFSGGPDSTALIALATHAGLRVTAWHVDHRLRPESAADAERAAAIAEQLGARFQLQVADLDDGPNLEARARSARRSLLPDDAMTGHTADDQAETLLLALLRGSGATGLAAMRPGPTHPILGLRRHETLAVCEKLGLSPLTDPSNVDPRFRRNRLRHEVVPLLDDVAERDVAPLLARAADLVRDDDDLLESLAAGIVPTDVAALRDAPLPLARRALRRWLTIDGYPPDAAAIERVLAVVRHEAAACEVGGGRRVSRSEGRLRVE